MLVPVTPSLALVQKLADRDPDGASELVRFALYEVLCDLTDRHRESLDRVFSKAMLTRADGARRGLVRAYVRKRLNGEDVGDVLTSAAYLTSLEVEVAKGPFSESKHRRDPYTGRFVAFLPDRGDHAANRAAAADQIASWMKSGLISPGAKVHLVGEQTRDPSKAGYEMYETPNDPVNMKRELHDDLGEMNHLNPRQVEVHPAETNQQRGGNRGRVFDAMSSATSASTAHRATRNAPLDRESFGRELDNAVSTSSDKDRRAYRQVSAAGRGLQAVSTPGSAPHILGGIAQVAGELGPEAERVLGPGIRRTAYRYRGTERTPNAQLAREVSDSTPLADALSSGNTDAVRGLLGRGNAGLAVGTASAYADQANQMSPDELKLAMRGDTAIGYLSRKVPDPERAELSFEAGRVPPSQGVIINRAGDVVSEAMGAGSDHYLPFDLKNLKSLQGGQYARTRVAGGPTTEDIYTGLLSGARQIQVVSNSGVFTVQFDPSLRGSRRYSDKARQMVTRYQALLDRIKSSQSGDRPLYSQDLSPAEQSRIRHDAFERAGYDKTLGEQYAREDIDQARTRAQFDTPDDDELMEAARNTVMSQARSGKLQIGSRGALERAVQDEFHTQLQGVKDQRVQSLALDGEGYARALQSLQQEFPYFIRSDVKYETRRGFDAARSHRSPDEPLAGGGPRVRDKGYVGPNQITANDNYRLGAGGGNSQTATSSSKPGTSGGDTGGTSGGGARIPDLKAYKPTTSGKLEDISGDLESNLVDSLTAVKDQIDGSLEGMTVDETDLSPDGMQRLLQSGNAVQWMRGYVTNAGGWRQVAAKLSKASPAELAKAHEAMEKAEAKDKWAVSQGSTDAHSPEIAANYAKAKQDLRTAMLVRNQPKDVGGDPALYSPDDPTTAAPPQFKEISDLGTDPNNYQGFLDAQKGTGFEQAVKTLESKKPEERAKAIKDMVRKYQNTVAWAAQDNPRAQPSGAVLEEATTHARAREIAGQKSKHPAYKKLAHHQAAWSFLHQREGVQQLTGGGPGKAGAPAAGAAAPAFQPPTVRQPEHQPVRKARRRIVLHPPGSPLAVAFAKAAHRKRAATSTR